MNIISLAQARVKNQHQESSRIDDLFDLRDFVAGVTKVSHHKRNLNDYALDMVGSFAKFKDHEYELSLDSLSNKYQLELARLYIESIDREIEWACYGEDQTINSDFLCALLSMLKDNNSDTRENFAQVTMQNILIYYKEPLQKTLDDACIDFYHNQMTEAGYRCDQDMEHGDIIWGKF